MAGHTAMRLESAEMGQGISRGFPVHGPARKAQEVGQKTSGDWEGSGKTGETRERGDAGARVAIQGALGVLLPSLKPWFLSDVCSTLLVRLTH